MVMERTFMMIKPGSVERGLVGEIIGRFEKKGLKIVALKLSQPTRALMEEHYKEHQEKSFYEELVSYMTSGLAISVVLEGEDAIAGARKIAGTTDPKEAEPGTIRGDYGIDLRRNVVHASDSIGAAIREIALHFDGSFATKLVSQEAGCVSTAL
jgi:nucleoside-diphosphate kinase